MPHKQQNFPVINIHTLSTRETLLVSARYNLQTTTTWRRERKCDKNVIITIIFYDIATVVMSCTYRFIYKNTQYLEIADKLKTWIYFNLQMYHETQTNNISEFIRTKSRSRFRCVFNEHLAIPLNNMEQCQVMRYQ